MAVQAAMMTSQFMDFCFPGSGLEYEMEKTLDGGFLGDMGCEGDFRETTRDLLSFIDSASSNIKLALDKPVKSKRKVNHRKYLQKQIKRCTGIAGPGGVAPDPAKRQGSPGSNPGGPQGRPPTKRDGGVQASLQSRSLAALFDPVTDTRGERARKPPLRQRNLPPSFFTEPANSPRVTSTSGMTLKDLERGNPEAAEFFELLGPDYSNMVAEPDVPQGALARAPREAPVEHDSYDPHPLVGGFLYAEPWGACTSPPKKASACGLAQNVRTPPAQHPMYCHSDSVSPSPLEESGQCVLSFPGFFTDCSLPQVTYDFAGGYNRSGFPSL